MATIPSSYLPSGPTKAPEQINIEPARFKSNLIDTAQTNKTDILTAIQGAPITVIYYAQVIGSTQYPLTFQGNEVMVYEQYRKINNMVFALQGDLQGSQDADNAGFTVNGTAVTYPHFTPMRQDNFCMALRDGRMGFFTITSVTRKSFYANSVYEVEFRLLQWVDTSFINEINKRVVEELYFNMDLLQSNREPFFTPEENVSFEFLNERLNELSTRCHLQFYNRNLNTLNVANVENLNLIDPFLTQFYEFAFGDRLGPTGIESFTHYRLESLSDYRSLTILNLIAERKYGLSDMIKQKLLPLTSRAFASYSEFGSVLYSGIAFVVFPLTRSVITDASLNGGTSTQVLNCNKKALHVNWDTGGVYIDENPGQVEIIDGSVTYGHIPGEAGSGCGCPTTDAEGRLCILDESGNPILDEDGKPIYADENGIGVDPAFANLKVGPWWRFYPKETTPSPTKVQLFNSANPNQPIDALLVPKITEDPYYIFTKNFYDAIQSGTPSTPCSVFEIAVLDYLHRKPQNKDTLYQFIKDVPNWSNYQRFYLLPILAVLIKSFMYDL